MKNSKLWVGVLVVLVVVASFSLFTVHEREKAILFQLGRIVKSDYEPGLYFKIPFVQNVRTFDARIQTLDSPPELYLTSEKKNVLVDSFVKWRVNDVDRFFTSTGGSVTRAGQRLSEVIKRGLKDEFGKRTIQEVVSGERAAIMNILAVTTDKAAQEFGIAVTDVRIKRIDLPVEVSNSVFQRMQAERQRVARDFRAGSARSSWPRPSATPSACAARATPPRRRPMPMRSAAIRSSSASTAASSPTGTASGIRAI